KSQIHEGHPASSGCPRCCSCCCYFCFTKEDEKVYPSTGLDRRLDLISQRAAEPAGLAYRHQQQAKSQLAPAPPEPQEQRRLLLAAPAPEVTLTFSLTRLSDCLAVHLHSAESTPGPRLGLCHCNFAQAQLVTSSASDYVILETVRTDRVPSVQRNSGAAAGGAERLMLLLRCLDFDRFSRERIVGEALLQLPADIGRPVQYDRLPLRLPQTGSCELLVALHYVPSAERLSVMRPVYNESVGIDLPERRLDRVSLIVSVMSCRLNQRRVQPDLDACLGYVVFSSNCYGSGRAHWDQMVHRPRAALAYWHRRCVMAASASDSISMLRTPASNARCRNSFRCSMLNSQMAPSKSLVHRVTAETASMLRPLASCSSSRAKSGSNTASRCTGWPRMNYRERRSQPWFFKL
uniref:C2 DOCK-type domain-containing protein n=1 Tax=Macrostomum lignano TaxID=282301 RepID=A0A1I8I773_9PLAT